MEGASVTAKKRKYTKIALALSICLMILWGLLGTGTSLAWFTDTSPTIRNSFLVGELKLKVSYKQDNGQYTAVDATKSIFDDEALYEPGYVQVVYLKVENEGDVPFDYKLSVDVNNVHTVESMLGNEIYLPNYLRFGVMFGNDEAALTRVTAELLANERFPEATGTYPLNTYSEEDVTVPVGGTRYIALIVRMPKEVDNVANYRGDTPPTVDLGITVLASQEGTL